jgi:acetylornithine deacetylase
VVQAVLRHARERLGSRVAEVGGLGWMDSALLAAAGIPTVVFGPGGEGAHAVVEWADLVQLEQCAEILTAVAADFCA